MAERWLTKVNPCRYCSPACNGVARRGTTPRAALRAEIVRIYATEELSPPQVAERLGIGKMAVYHHLKAAGVTVKKRRHPVICTCKHCGCAFESWPAAIAQGGGQYCGRACYGAARKRDLAERFWAKVDKTGECWLWTAGLGSTGYGQFSSGKHGAKPLKAHRVAYELAYGPIPAGQHVCHRCDTPACVRPEHLFLGTRADNMADMRAKGRAADQADNATFRAAVRGGWSYRRAKRGGP